MTPQDKARALRPLIERSAASLSDADALEAVELFPAWAPDVDAQLGDRVRRGTRLYRCVQAHHTQPGWEPETVPALWTEVAKPGEIPVWRQPTGAQDAYMTGDRVRYPAEADPVYISTIDNNVWEPTVYGWAAE